MHCKSLTSHLALKKNIKNMPWVYFKHRKMWEDHDTIKFQPFCEKKKKKKKELRKMTLDM